MRKVGLCRTSRVSWPLLVVVGVGQSSMAGNGPIPSHPLHLNKRTLLVLEQRRQNEGSRHDEHVQSNQTGMWNGWLELGRAWTRIGGTEVHLASLYRQSWTGWHPLLWARAGNDYFHVVPSWNWTKKIEMNLRRRILWRWKKVFLDLNQSESWNGNTREKTRPK